jgi:hypothetical protein
MTDDSFELPIEDIFNLPPLPYIIYEDGHFIDNHPHAIIKDGIVINIVCIYSHNEEIAEAVKIASGGDLVVCGCNYGKTFGIGWTWDGIEFIERIDNG